MIHHFYHKVAAACAAAVLLTACAGSKEDPYIEQPVGQLYNTALVALEEREYQAAAKAFDEVERQHPYSAWATKAQIMAAYSNYQINQYDDAIVALERFIQLHPSNPETPYAYYLKGLCFYEQIADVGRDQQMTQSALGTLQELVTRYPKSPYARDAKVKIDLTNDHLAGKEMEIGRYYLTRDQHLAAINRFKTVIARYDTTTHVPEALHRLTEAYIKLGLQDEAHKTAAVLGYNFPDSEWYIDSYELVEGVKLRTYEERPWYQVWGTDKKLESVELAKPDRPWYQLWRSNKADDPRAAIGSPQPESAATRQPAGAQSKQSVPQVKGDPWYKFW